MNPERFRLIRSIFDAASAQPMASREAYIKDACAGDEELLADIQRLLEAQDEPTAGIEEFGLGAFPERPPMREGQMLGSYLLIRQLGRGGFGEVWEAESVTGRRLALKILPASLSGSPKSIERFKREGKLAASVNHPQCVFIFGAEEIGGYPAITMELMRGGTLQDRLNAEGPIPARKAVDLILDIVSGLEAAQDAGILHRDIKPSNCFLDETGRAKIGDFGISRTLVDAVDLSMTGTFIGTPSYASPEQVRGKDLGIQSDIYSVGATLYTLLTGAPPFQATNVGEILGRIVAGEMVPFPVAAPPVPKALQRVVLRAMSKEKERRFHNYRELRTALLPFSSNALTTGSLVKRFLAYQIDLLLFRVLAIVASWLADPSYLFYLTLLPVNYLFTGFPFAVFLIAPLIYFPVTETLWGRSLGKRLLGLRVTAADGSPVNSRSVSARTLVLVAVSLLPSMLHVAQLRVPGISFLVQCVVLVTMRRRNGYAGLHEILSGTRVVSIQDRDAIVVPTVPMHGWENGSESLTLSHDELLDRSMWIHRHSLDSSQPMAVLAENRQSRLRWLQGSRGPAVWDAYEAPAGIDFLEWVRMRGRLSWLEVRSVLAAVSEELKAIDASGGSPIRFSLRHIWIDSYGNAKLMNFPAVRDEALHPASHHLESVNGPRSFERSHSLA